MRVVRNALGVISILLLLVGLNLLLLEETLFRLPVVATLAVGALVGLLWLVTWAAGAARRRHAASLGILNGIVSSAIFLAICVTIYAFVMREERSWDLTNEGRRDISAQTQLVLQSLTQPVEITCFFVNAGDDRARVAQTKTRQFLERCEEYTDQLDIEYIDPQLHPERLDALQVLRVSTVGNIVLKSGSRQRELPLSDVNARLEERDFTNALLNVSRNVIPKIYFLAGHGERDILNNDPVKGGSKFALWLQKEAYEVDRCLILADNPVVPEDCSVLVINGYTADLGPHEILALDQFISDGGRILVLSDVLVVANSDVPFQEQLRPWLLSRLGINIGDDLLVSIVGKAKIMFLPDFELMGELADDVPETPDFRGSFNAVHPITRTLDKTFQLGVARSVSLAEELPSGTTGHVLLRSAPDTWAETDVRAVFEGRDIVRDAHEGLGAQSAMAAVSWQPDLQASPEDRTPDARVVVLGDADIASNELIDYQSSQDLLLNTIAWLTESPELIAIRPTGELDQPIILTQQERRLIMWIASLGTVQAVALAGVIVYFLRRKYR